MASSTLHSDRRPPWWAILLGAIALLTWAITAAYSLWWNPEVAFFRSGHQKKQAWMQAMRARFGTNVLIFGGSSCASSIQSRRLVERHDLPGVNLGFGAGMGAGVLSQYALEAMRPGDTLIVALEPDLLTRAFEREPLGVQFALSIGRPGLVREQGRMDWPAALLDLRPGSYHVFTLLGKVLLGQPLYRYSPEDFKEDGWQEINDRRPFAVPPLAEAKPSAAALSRLQGLREECRARGVRVAATLPWQYCAPDQLAALQRKHLVFLRELATVLPCLREPSLGAHSQQADFGDTMLHLLPDAAGRRTDELAAAIKGWTLWTAAEIDARLASSP